MLDTLHVVSKEQKAWQTIEHSNNGQHIIENMREWLAHCFPELVQMVITFLQMLNAGHIACCKQRKAW